MSKADKLRSSPVELSVPSSECSSPRPDSRVGMWIALMLLVCYGYFFPRWADWGVNSKMDLTMAIVDQGEFSIDSYYQNTGDYALYKGRRYSDKAPGTSFLGVPVYATFKAVVSTSLLDGIIERLARNPGITDTLRKDGTGLLLEKVYFAMALYAVTFFVMSVTSALLGYFLFRFLGYFIADSAARALLVILYGLGTVAFPYSQTFNGRQLSAVMTVICFYLLFRIKRQEISERYMWLVGALMGYVVITDYPSALILAVLFVYAVVFLRRPRRVLPLLIAGLPPVLLMAYYNYSIFETPLPVGYYYSALYQDLHSQGLISLTYPKWEAIYGLTFSPFRGLFFFSPALLLAIPGFIYWHQSRNYRSEWWVCVLSIVASFLTYSSSVMWWGGFAVGPAYLTAIVPYFVFPIAYFVKHHQDTWRVWALLISLTVLSVFAIGATTIAGQSFPDLNPNPLFTLSMPALMAGDIARNAGMLFGLRGLSSLLPLLLVFLIMMLLIFRQNFAAFLVALRIASKAVK